MKPVSIGSNDFKSQKDAIFFVKNRIRDIGFGIIDETSEHYEFMTNLLENHPEKDSLIGCGVKHFDIRTHPFVGGRHIYLVRTDDTEDVMSYKYCCSKTVKPPRYYINNMCRLTLKPIISQFRSNKPCQFCFTFENLHVHHDTRSFRCIVDEFVQTYGEDACSKFVRDKYGIPVMPTELAEKFVELHNKLSTLMVLCKDCHVERHRHML